MHQFFTGHMPTLKEKCVRTLSRAKKWFPEVACPCRASLPVAGQNCTPVSKPVTGEGRGLAGAQQLRTIPSSSAGGGGPPSWEELVTEVCTKLGRMRGWQSGKHVERPLWPLELSCPYLGGLPLPHPPSPSVCLPPSPPACCIGAAKMTDTRSVQ